MEKKDYKLLAEPDPHALSQEVNKFLKAGYSLYGSPVVAYCNIAQDQAQLWHYQAVYRILTP